MIGENEYQKFFSKIILMSNKYFGPDISRVISKLGLIFVLSLVFGWIYFKYYNSAHHWFIKNNQE